MANGGAISIKEWFKNNVFSVALTLEQIKFSYGCAWSRSPARELSTTEHPIAAKGHEGK